MKTLIRAELDKLCTLRSTWIALSASVLLSPVIAAIVLATTKHLSDAPATIADSAFGFSGVATALLCAHAFAAEYEDQTIASVFTLVPARWKIVLAKCVAAMIAGALVAGLSTAASYALAAVWLHSSGVTWPWSVSELLRAAFGDLVVGAAVPVAGVGVGGLTQSPQAAGAFVGLVWLGLSNLLASLLTVAKHYGITAAQITLTQPTGHHAYSFAAALAVTLALSAVLVLAGLRRVRLADV